MAKVIPNAITTNLTGKLGHVVFRKHQGETIVQLLPRQSESGPSEAQRARQARFQQAALYAKAILSDPLRQQVYRALGAARKRPPNTILIANFLNPPTVDLIDASGYQGCRGDRIRVLATDDIQVVSVTVTVRDEAGAVIESGTCGQDHGVWFYEATVDVAAGRAVTIEATAQDRPGNKATELIRTVTGSPPATSAQS